MKRSQEMFETEGNKGALVSRILKYYSASVTATGSTGARTEGSGEQNRKPGADPGIPSVTKAALQIDTETGTYLTGGAETMY